MIKKSEWICCEINKNTMEKGRTAELGAALFCGTGGRYGPGLFEYGCFFNGGGIFKPHEPEPAGAGGNK